jgi:hypothetical protein
MENFMIGKRRWDTSDRYGSRSDRRESVLVCEAILFPNQIRLALTGGA